LAALGDSTDGRRLTAARRLVGVLAETLDLDLSIRLWDGSRIPLGRNVRSPFEIVVENAGVLSSLIRRPTPGNLMLHYADGSLRLEGGDPLDFISAAESNRGIRRLSQLPKWRTLRAAVGVAMGRTQHAGSVDAARRESGKRATAEADRIEFHYDIGNEFYALFLGREMQYSCGYFEKSEFDLDRAQDAKLDRICQGLQLQRGERFLDVGCGWGGLLCHAAERYGVRAHGLTLSPAQFEYAGQKIRERGLEAQVTVELADYSAASASPSVLGEDRSARIGYDKIASIEMIEHIGLANYPKYFKKLRSLLRKDGLLMVQATMRRAKRTVRRSKKLRIGSRLIERYVFPGFELDNLGSTTAAMEAARFEILETSGWREHYAMTTASWCRRLWARQKEADAVVGPEKTRLWLAYLAGVSVAFEGGSLRVYQILASRQGHSGRAERPPNRLR
jgi:cyclopropane-fatty-acyl-phospholipid synthase